MTDYKLLPLGISDFRRIRKQNYYYVDKSMYIPKIELASSYLFFVRPSRFGKSLSYYCEKGVISLDVEEMVAWLTPMHALTMPSYDSCCSSTSLTNIARVSSSRLHRMGIYNKVKDYFPAIELVKEENFVSLLFYYGMITMTGTFEGQQRLGIPNNNVRRPTYCTRISSS